MASVFECTRCNSLTYSASRAVIAACERCGSTNMRVLDEVSFEAAEIAPRTASTGDHCLVLAEDGADAARAVLPFIEEALRDGDRVLVLLPIAVCARIAELLGPRRAMDVQFVDGATMYAVPFDAAETIAAVVDITRSEPTPMRVVGGPMGDPLEIAPASEWERYELLAHEACLAEGVTALCVWEAPLMSDELLAIVRRTHSLVKLDDSLRRNPDFVWSTP